MRLAIALACVVALHTPSESTAFSNGNLHKSKLESSAITTITNTRSRSRLSNKNALLALQAFKIPNPFASNENDAADSNSENSSDPPDDLGAEPLFARAKSILSSDLGVKDPVSLADDFVWIGPSFSRNVLNKEEYLAAGKFFDLRTTFPDLDYRAHDFRLDSKDPLTVRFTARVVGTMRGQLRLRGETIPPNGKRMVCPPEAISMTFDADSGKLTKLCSGFTMDRLVGNTKGLCGVMAAATIAGKPPSDWELYPANTVVSRIFARPVKQLPEEQSNFLSPFPETVMIQLAKGVIAADNGASDPDLLSPDFTFMGPIVGPIGKDEFVKAFGGFDIKGGLPDLDSEFSNFRVDPYDPYRVWVDARGSGTRTGEFAGAEPNGLRYEGPPEAVSLTFDDDGFCTRLTAGVVIDPSEGNTGGLGGVFGILYATGTPLPGVVTRPIPDLLSRLQKRALSPITNIDVDQFTKEKKAPPAPPKTPVKPKPPAPETASEVKPKLPTPVAVSEVKPKPPAPETVSKSFVSSPPSPPKAPVESVIRALPKPPAPQKKPVVASAPKPPAPPKPAVVESTPKPPAPTSAVKKVPITEEPADPVTDAFSSLFGLGNKDAEPAVKEEEKKETPKKIIPPPVQKKNVFFAAESKKAPAPSANANKEAAAARAQEMKEKAAATAAAAEAAKKEKAEKIAAVEARKAELEAKRLAAAEAAEKKKQEAKAAAEARKAELEAKRQAAAEAAEKKKQEAIAAAEARKAELEAKRQADEQKKQEAAAAAEARKAALEAKRQAAAEAAEQKKQAATAAAEAKRREFEERKQKMAKAAAAEKAMSSAKPRQTISLFGLFGSDNESDTKESAAPSVSKSKSAALKSKSAAPKSKSAAPAGVPKLSKWTQSPDRTITGNISGSGMFGRNEQVTTSPIKSGTIASGNVVITQSGSKYYLE